MVNAGRIDLTNGGSSTSDSFTVVGNYTGQDGLLFIDTVLEGTHLPRISWLSTEAPRQVTLA